MGCNPSGHIKPIISRLSLYSIVSLDTALLMVLVNVTSHIAFTCSYSSISDRGSVSVGLELLSMAITLKWLSTVALKPFQCTSFVRLDLMNEGLKVQLWVVLVVGESHDSWVKANRLLCVPGGDDRRVLLWHMEKAIHSRAKPLKLKGEHLSNIFCLAFDSTNKKVFSGGKDSEHAGFMFWVDAKVDFWY